MGRPQERPKSTWTYAVCDVIYVSKVWKSNPTCFIKLGTSPDWHEEVLSMEHDSIVHRFAPYHESMSTVTVHQVLLKMPKNESARELLGDDEVFGIVYRYIGRDMIGMQQEDLLLLSDMLEYPL